MAEAAGSRVNRIPAFGILMSRGSARSLARGRDRGTGEEKKGLRNGGKSTLNPRQRQTRQSVGVSTTGLCESNYHNDVKEPNQQSGANLSCITGLSFLSAPQLNAFLMKIFLDLQIISHSLQRGYQSSLSGLFFFIYIYIFVVYIYISQLFRKPTPVRREREDIPHLRQGGMWWED